MTPKIIVHGGASNANENEPERQKDVINACKIGYEILLEKEAIDAVEIAIQNLEASAYLNAGVGSYLQLDGRVRMDASIMKDDLSAGAVIGIEELNSLPAEGGLICIDKDGTIRYAYNTKFITMHYIE